MTFRDFIKIVRTGYRAGNQVKFAKDLIEAWAHSENKFYVDDEAVGKWISGRNLGYQNAIRELVKDYRMLDDEAFIDFFASRMSETWRDVQKEFKTITSECVIECDATSERDFWQSVLRQFKIIVGAPLTVHKAEEHAPPNRMLIGAYGFDINGAEKQNGKMSGTLAAQASMLVPPQEYTPPNITIQYEDGSYIGEYMIDETTGIALRHGYGKRFWNDESFFVGEYVGGAMCGRGTLTTSRGVVVDAIWKDNRINGDVKTTNGMGVYIGYIDDKRSYVSKIIFNNGYTFEGAFVGSSVDGTLFHPDGRSGRFICNPILGLKILSGDEDMRRDIARFPHLHGKKIIYLDAGVTYEGEIKDETPHGHGRNTFPNEMVLEMKSDMGEIVDNRGIWTFPHATFYGIKTIECVWQNGKWFGSRVVEDITIEYYLSQDGDLISAKEIYDDGAWAELVVGATPEGRMLVKFSDGSVWNGTWVDEMKNGDFTITFPNCIVETRFENDIPVGLCRKTLKDGAAIATSEFEWEDGAFHGGHIKIIYPDRSLYEGEGDHNGIPNGQGVLTLTNGEMYSGKWEDGRFDHDGTSLGFPQIWEPDSK